MQYGSCEQEVLAEYASATEVLTEGLGICDYVEVSLLSDRRRR